MCNFLTQIIMSSFLSHFPIFYAFFSTKTTDSVVTSGSHFLRNEKKGSFPYFWHKNLAYIFKKAIKKGSFHKKLMFQ
jgi:hypothetical protein